MHISVPTAPTYSATLIHHCVFHTQYDNQLKAHPWHGTSGGCSRKSFYQAAAETCKQTGPGSWSADDVDSGVLHTSLLPLHLHHMITLPSLQTMIFHQWAYDQYCLNELHSFHHYHQQQRCIDVSCIWLHLCWRWSDRAGRHYSTKKSILVPPSLCVQLPWTHQSGHF